MATLWSILATLALIASVGSFLMIMYPRRSLSSESRNGFSIVMVAAGFLTVFALRLALGMP